MTKTTGTTTPIVAYYRVSTARQGQSGLGLEAQRAAVAGHIAHTGAPLIAEFTEVETGTRKRHRPELERALVQARASGAVLVIGKFDRLARDVAFLSTLMNGDVPFRALDLLHASRSTLHVLAAVAEKGGDRHFGADQGGAGRREGARHEARQSAEPDRPFAAPLSCGS